MGYRIGWFSTGRDKAARDLLTAIYEAIRKDEIKAGLSFVFCNRVFGESEESDIFLRMVEDYGINLISCSSKAFRPGIRKKGRRDPEALVKWRTEYHDEVERTLAGYAPDLNVLAGYMLIASSKMCERLDMINLHPAEPGGPSGTWQEVIWKLIGSNAASSGVMIHLVTRELDGGPSVTYCTFPIQGPAFHTLWDDLHRRLETKGLGEIIDGDGERNGLFMEIRKHGFMREMPLLVQTIKAFADGRVRIEDKKIWVGDEVVKDGLCLNKEIENRLDAGKDFR